jgi:hypothetical protein
MAEQELQYEQQNVKRSNHGMTSGSSRKVSRSPTGGQAKACTTIGDLVNDWPIPRSGSIPSSSIPADRSFGKSILFDVVRLQMRGGKDVIACPAVSSRTNVQIEKCPGVRRLV